MASREGARSGRAGSGRARITLSKSRGGARPPATSAGVGAGAPRVTQSITIDQPREELFLVLHDPSLLPRLMDGVEQVQRLPGEMPASARGTYMTTLVMNEPSG